MKRGEIWTVAGGAAYASKPRPAVIVQDDRFDANDSIVVCPLTTDQTQAPIFRLPVEPSAQSGLRAPCRMMADTLTAVPRRRFGRLVGSLASDEVKALGPRHFRVPGLGGNGSVARLAHAAPRSPSKRLSQPWIWFQLANVRVTR
jgi:mRNA interferase MazF